ncbi:MAG: diadenylate cyclase CdaA [Candidatus Dormibacteria bacterium]
MHELLRNLQIFLENFGWKDVLDILIVAVVLYFLLRLIRDTQAFQILLGLVVIALIGIVAQALQLRLLSFIYQNSIQAVVITVVILFQPELRRALNQIGGFGSVRIHRHRETDRMKLLDQLVQAVAQLQENRWGALIVLEQSSGLETVVSSGIRIDATFSRELLLSVFYPNAPLHDGALILREGRVLAAGCVLPLPEPLAKGEQMRYGTRHRAALGLSMESDAIVVVVSEERGSLAIAHRGEMLTNLSLGALRENLERELAISRTGSRNGDIPDHAEPEEVHR